MSRTSNPKCESPSWLAVGWDQSLNHGAVVVLAPDGRLVDCTCQVEKVADALALGKDRAYRLPAWLTKIEDPSRRSIIRLSLVRDFIRSVVGRLGSDPAIPPPGTQTRVLGHSGASQGHSRGISATNVYVAVEDYALGKSQGAHQLGEVGGILRLGLMLEGIHLRLHVPSAVKRYATGHGDADKYDMLHAARCEWGDTLDSLATRTGQGTAEDIADAYWLARMARDEQLVRLGELPLDALKPHERDAFLRVTDKQPVNLLARYWITLASLERRHDPD